MEETLLQKDYSSMSKVEATLLMGSMSGLQTDASLVHLGIQ